MNNYTLYISLRSPFARRVRILLEEVGANYETQVVDVFNPPQWLFDVNPFGRVPVLKLVNGQALCDSHEIQRYIESAHSDNSLFQRHGRSLAKVLNYTATACGIMDLVVANFIETLRPAGTQQFAVREEMLECVNRALRFFESELQGEYLLGQNFTACDIDLGAAIGYTDLRVGKSLIDAYPKLRAYYGRLSSRPSFQESTPPA